MHGARLYWQQLLPNYADAQIKAFQRYRFDPANMRSRNSIANLSLPLRGIVRFGRFYHASFVMNQHFLGKLFVWTCVGHKEGHGEHVCGVGHDGNQRCNPKIVELAAL
uniref:Uncharacterized protein n=1 Tax=Lotharella globosa TaxID=91324 RepID=A0A7S3Z5Z8_9EUKA